MRRYPAISVPIQPAGYRSSNNACRNEEDRRVWTNVQRAGRRPAKRKDYPRRWNQLLVHYLREIEDTVMYRNPGKEFHPIGKRLRRILRDAIRSDKEYLKVEDRLRAKLRLEKRIGLLISARYKERNCLLFVKRLKREMGMLFTFLEKECDWHNNAAERAIRPSVVVRKALMGTGQRQEPTHMLYL